MGVLLQRARAESTRSQELLRASAAAVICVAVEQLLNHVQKEKAGTLWDCLLTAADSRVKACNRTGKHPAVSRCCDAMHAADNRQHCFSIGAVLRGTF